MALYTFICNYLMPLHFKGSILAALAYMYSAGRFNLPLFAFLCTEHLNLCGFVQ